MLLSLTVIYGVFNKSQQESAVLVLLDWQILLPPGNTSWLKYDWMRTLL